VQAAINASNSLLPNALLPAPPVYAKVNPADAPVITLAVSFRLPAHHHGRGPGRQPHRPGRFRNYPASVW